MGSTAPAAVAALAARRTAAAVKGFGCEDLARGTRFKHHNGQSFLVLHSQVVAFDLSLVVDHMLHRLCP